MLKYLLSSLCIVIIFCGCWVIGGTHGFIKSYEFAVNTDTMRHKIEMFIENSDNIQYLNRADLITEIDRETGKVIDTLSNKDDYNDRNQYSRIIIFHNVDTFEFVFQYSAITDTLYTSKYCDIAIIQAFKNRNQKNAGGYNRSFGMFQQRAKQSYIKVFETEFIDKLSYKYIRTEEP